MTMIICVEFLILFIFCCQSAFDHLYSLPLSQSADDRAQSTLGGGRSVPLEQGSGVLTILQTLVDELHQHVQLVGAEAVDVLVDVSLLHRSEDRDHGTRVVVLQNEG